MGAGEVTKEAGEVTKEAGVVINLNKAGVDSRAAGAINLNKVGVDSRVVGVISLPNREDGVTNLLSKADGVISKEDGVTNKEDGGIKAEEEDGDKNLFNLSIWCCIISLKNRSFRQSFLVRLEGF